jgi:nicotinamide riboside transporter PnuC
MQVPSDNKPLWLKVLDYVGAVAGVLGATIIALNLGLNFWGYAVFLISSTFYMVFGYATRNWGLMTMNIIFCGVNVIGLVRYF